ncbi:MAG: hypothetical protein Q9178_007903 [Gyalolechia marmorata]
MRLNTILVGDSNDRPSIEGGANGTKNKQPTGSFHRTTALSQSGGFAAVLQRVAIESCGIGVNTTRAGSLGSLVTLDFTLINSEAMVKFRDSSLDDGDRNLTGVAV